MNFGTCLAGSRFAAGSAGNKANLQPRSYLQHIDFPLPRKHKPARFIVSETTPLTTLAAPSAPRLVLRPLADHLLQIFRNRITID
jgi:hypothetical protein